MKTISASVAAIITIETVFRFAIDAKIAAPLPALGVIRCVESIILLAITLLLEKDLSSIGLSRNELLGGLKKGLLWSAGFGIFAGVLFVVLKICGINTLRLLLNPRSPSGLQLFLLFLIGALVAPIAEEIFFRGIIFGFFRRWGSVPAILVSTLLFVFTHPVGANLPITQLVGGIVFALSYEIEKNLMVPITIHCLGNIAIFSLPLLV
jgi:membrane protease YdiL (CAAX protease family)